MLDTLEVLFTEIIPVLFEIVEDVGHGPSPLGVVIANEDDDDAEEEEEELEFATPPRGELIDTFVAVNPPTEVVVELPPPRVLFAGAEALPRVVGALAQLELLVETVNVLFERGTDEKLLMLEPVLAPGEEVKAKYAPAAATIITTIIITAIATPETADLKLDLDGVLFMGVS